MLTAPPWTLTFEDSRPSSCMLTSETTLNASLISHNATSSALTPACSSTLGMTSEGVIVKSTGAVAASANATGSKTHRLGSSHY